MMKQVVLAICLLIGVQVFAQVQFGVKAGGNIATTKDLIAFPKNRVGWYGGLFASFPVNKRIDIESEMNFSSIGYRYVDLSDGKINSMRMNYLTLPLLFGIKIDQKTILYSGPQIGYLLKAVHGREDINSVATTKSFPVKLDFGVFIGLKYEVSQKFGCEIRYVYGKNGFYQTDVVGTRRSDSDAAHRVFQIGLTYGLLK